MFVYLQSFEPDDYRNIRFTNAERYVNKNWGTICWFVQIYVEMIQRLQFYSFLDVLCFAGIDLVAEVPPKECTERVVCCDGGDPHLGHPKVYINLVRYWFESGIDWHDEVNLIITFVF